MWSAPTQGIAKRIKPRIVGFKEEVFLFLSRFKQLGNSAYKKPPWPGAMTDW